MMQMQKEKVACSPPPFVSPSISKYSGGDRKTHIKCPQCGKMLGNHGPGIASHKKFCKGKKGDKVGKKRKKPTGTASVIKNPTPVFYLMSSASASDISEHSSEKEDGGLTIENPERALKERRRGGRKNKHRYRGISRLSDDRWLSRVTKRGKQILLGYFDSADEAARAYDAAAMKFHGSEAILNFTYTKEESCIAIARVGVDIMVDVKSGFSGTLSKAKPAKKNSKQGTDANKFPRMRMSRADREMVEHSLAEQAAASSSGAMISDFYAEALAETRRFRGVFEVKIPAKRSESRPTAEPASNIVVIEAKSLNKCSEEKPIAHENSQKGEVASGDNDQTEDTSTNSKESKIANIEVEAASKSKNLPPKYTDKGRSSPQIKEDGGDEEETMQTRWNAKLALDDKTIDLGTYESKVEAARAYDRAALKHFGAKATLNFPSTGCNAEDGSGSPSLRRRSRRARQEVEKFGAVYNDEREYGVSVATKSWAAAGGAGPPTPRDLSQMEKEKAASTSTVEAINAASTAMDAEDDEDNEGGDEDKNRVFRGVTQVKAGRFLARVTLKGKQIPLGYFDTKAEAARAYDAGALKYHGDRATLNFESSRRVFNKRQVQLSGTSSNTSSRTRTSSRSEKDKDGISLDTRKRTEQNPYRGVSEVKSGRWLARISTGGRQRPVGYYDTAEAAARAYDRAALRFHGERATLNFEDSRKGSHLDKKEGGSKQKKEGTDNKKRKHTKKLTQEEGDALAGEYYGVGYCAENGNWIGELVVNGVSLDLGVFDTAKQAAEAYDDAAIKYTEEDTALNFPRRKRAKKLTQEEGDSVAGEYYGVGYCAENGNWIGELVVNGVSLDLGVFDTAKQAAEAYDEAAIKYTGDDAALNFPRRKRAKDPKRKRLRSHSISDGSAPKSTQRESVGIGGLGEIKDAQLQGSEGSSVRAGGSKAGFFMWPRLGDDYQAFIPEWIEPPTLPEVDFGEYMYAEVSVFLGFFKPGRRDKFRSPLATSIAAKVGARAKTVGIADKISKRGATAATRIQVSLPRECVKEPHGTIKSTESQPREPKSVEVADEKDVESVVAAIISEVVNSVLSSVMLKQDCFGQSNEKNNSADFPADSVKFVEQSEEDVNATLKTILDELVATTAQENGEKVDHVHVKQDEDQGKGIEFPDVVTNGKKTMISYEGRHIPKGKVMCNRCGKLLANHGPGIASHMKFCRRKDSFASDGGGSLVIAPTSVPRRRRASTDSKPKVDSDSEEEPTPVWATLLSMGHIPATVKATWTPVERTLFEKAVTNDEIGKHFNKVCKFINKGMGNKAPTKTTALCVQYYYDTWHNSRCHNNWKKANRLKRDREFELLAEAEEQEAKKKATVAAAAAASKRAKQAREDAELSDTTDDSSTGEEEEDQLKDGKRRARRTIRPWTPTAEDERARKMRRKLKKERRRREREMNMSLNIDKEGSSKTKGGKNAASPRIRVPITPTNGASKVASATVQSMPTLTQGGPVPRQRSTVRPWRSARHPFVPSDENEIPNEPSDDESAATSNDTNKSSASDSASLSTSETTARTTWCVCNGMGDGFMVSCDGCEEWFHGTCCGIRPNMLSDDSIFRCAKCAVISRKVNDESSSVAATATSATVSSSFTSLSLKQESSMCHPCAELEAPAPWSLDEMRGEMPTVTIVTLERMEVMRYVPLKRRPTTLLSMARGIGTSQDRTQSDTKSSSPAASAHADQQLLLAQARAAASPSEILLDPKAPKKNKAPYILFCQMRRPQIIAANPGIGFGEIGRKLGGEWRKMKGAGRQPWIARSEADRLRYEAEVSGFLNDQRILRQRKVEEAYAVVMAAAQRAKEEAAALAKSNVKAVAAAAKASQCSTIGDEPILLSSTTFNNSKSSHLTVDSSATLATIPATTSAVCSMAIDGPTDVLLSASPQTAANSSVGRSSIVEVKTESEDLPQSSSLHPPLEEPPTTYGCSTQPLSKDLIASSSVRDDPAQDQTSTFPQSLTPSVTSEVSTLVEEMIKKTVRNFQMLNSQVDSESLTTANRKRSRATRVSRSREVIPSVKANSSKLLNRQRLNDLKPEGELVSVEAFSVVIVTAVPCTGRYVVLLNNRRVPIWDFAKQCLVCGPKAPVVANLVTFLKANQRCIPFRGGIKPNPKLEAQQKKYNSLNKHSYSSGDGTGHQRSGGETQRNRSHRGGGGGVKRKKDPPGAKKARAIARIQSFINLLPPEALQYAHTERDSAAPQRKRSRNNIAPPSVAIVDTMRQAFKKATKDTANVAVRTSRVARRGSSATLALGAGKRGPKNIAATAKGTAAEQTAALTAKSAGFASNGTSMAEQMRQACAVYQQVLTTQATLKSSGAVSAAVANAPDIRAEAAAAASSLKSKKSTKDKDKNKAHQLELRRQRESAKRDRLLQEKRAFLVAQAQARAKTKRSTAAPDIPKEIRKLQARHLQMLKASQKSKMQRKLQLQTGSNSLAVGRKAAKQPSASSTKVVATNNAAPSACARSMKRKGPQESPRVSLMTSVSHGKTWASASSSDAPPPPKRSKAGVGRANPSVAAGGGAVRAADSVRRSVGRGRPQDVRIPSMESGKSESDGGSAKRIRRRKRVDAKLNDVQNTQLAWQLAMQREIAKDPRNAERAGSNSDLYRRATIVRGAQVGELPSEYKELLIGSANQAIHGTCTDQMTHQAKVEEFALMLSNSEKPKT